MKIVVFDSGPLINLSMNGLLYILKELKKNFDGKFLITRAVKYETVDRPIGISKFELGAIEIQNLIDEKVLELPESVDIEEKTIKTYTNELVEVANHYMKYDEKWIPLVSEAEMSCIALAAELKKRGVETIIAIDERTTRLLAENPASLESLMTNKMHMPVRMIAKNFDIFSPYQFIRSTELVFVAYKKGLVPLKGKKVLEALLYATKFKGSAVSFEEIDEIKRM